MIESNCIFCGAAPSTELIQQEGVDPYLELVRDEVTSTVDTWRICLQCGFVFRSPILDQTTMDLLYERYDQTVLSNQDPNEYFDRIVSLPPEESENTQKVIWLKDCLKRHAPDLVLSDLRVLDVGCGGGTLLHTLKNELQIEGLCGVELNPAYAALARRRLQVDIREEPHYAGLFGHSFDLVLNAKVLEHVLNPGNMMREIARDVAPNGWAFIETPDILDLWSLHPSNERFWIPHIWYFSRSTLGALAAASSLEVVESRTIVTSRGRSYLQILARPSLVAVQSELPFDSPREIIEKIVNRRVGQGA